MNNKGLKEITAIRNTEIICWKRDCICGAKQGKSGTDSMEILCEMEHNNGVGFKT